MRQPRSPAPQDFLLAYVSDLHDPASPRAPMWRTAPCPQELHHLLNFPGPYLPLLQHAQLVSSALAGRHHACCSTP